MTRQKRTTKATTTTSKSNGSKPSTIYQYNRPRDFRHRVCGRLLFRGYLTEGTRIEIRCPKCSLIAIFSSRPVDQGKVSIVMSETDET